MDEYALGCAATLAAVIVLASIVLPVITAVRLRRTLRALADVRERLRTVEARLDTLAGGTSPDRPEAERAATLPAPPKLTSTTPLREARSPLDTGAPGAKTAEVHGAGQAADTLETRIGGRGLLYAGTATLVFAIGFFVKYAFDNQWITETARVVLGGVAGLALIVAGRGFARRGHRLYGEVITGGGFVALYLSTWAALNLYDLVSRPVAFVVMVLITAGAALRADRMASQALALVAVLGGFATPALVGGPEDAQIILFSYISVLAAGTLYLAWRRHWPSLYLASYLLTVFTFFAWASTHYVPAKWVPTQVFLVILAAMFGWVYLRECRRVGVRDNPAPAIVFASILLLFHGGSLANLAGQAVALLVYLITVTLAGTLVSVRTDRAWVRLVTFVATVAVLLDWVSNHHAGAWLVPALAACLAHYLLLLAAAGERLARTSAPWRLADLVLFHGNAFALFAGLYIVVDASLPYATPALALGLAGWHGALAWRLRRWSVDAAVNGLAMTFAMLGFVIGLQLDDWWALVGWGVEAGAVYWAGLRTRRWWLRAGGGGLLAAVVAGLVSNSFFGTPAGFTAVWNPRAGATLAVIGVAYTMSFVFRRAVGTASARVAREYAALLVGANLLTLLLVSVEIHSFWHLRAPDDATAGLGLLASLSVAWGLYGTALVVVGIQRRYAPLRYLAIALLLLTVAKVFLIDLSELGGVYRIAGFLGLGVFLLLGSWLYQRYRDAILGD